MHSRSIVRTVAALPLIGLLSTAVAFAAVPAKGNAAAGKTIFDSKCVACHKLDGSGGVQLGPATTPNWKSPATWADPRRHDMDAYLRNTISNGDLAKGMVPFVKSGQLKPLEVEHILAHIHVLSGKK